MYEIDFNQARLQLYDIPGTPSVWKEKFPLHQRILEDSRRLTEQPTYVHDGVLYKKKSSLAHIMHAFPSYYYYYYYYYHLGIENVV